MKSIRFTIAACWLGLASCGDGQAGTDYRGEPLLSMKGVVSSTTFALGEGLLPAVVVREAPLSTNPVQAPHTEHVMLGEVEGVFPNAFTLRLYDAPPPATLEVLVDGEPAVALADFTAVPVGHPAWLRFGLPGQTRADGTMIDKVEVCSATECVSADPCMAAPAPSADWPCGSVFPNGRPWSRHGRAKDHRLVYLAGTAPAGGVLSRVLAGGKALAAGYHVLIIDLEEAMRQRPCNERAQQRALDTLAAVYGEEGREFRNEPGKRLEWNRHYIAAQAVEGCTIGATLVKDTTSTPVKLELVPGRSTTL